MPGRKKERPFAYVPPHYVTFLPQSNVTTIYIHINFTALVSTQWPGYPQKTNTNFLDCFLCIQGNI